MDEPNLQLATPIAVTDKTRRLAKTSVIAGIACWACFAIAFLLPLLIMPLMMIAFTTTANSTDSAAMLIPVQAVSFASAIGMFGYPIAMVLGVIALVAGIVALRKIGPDQSVPRSKNFALAGVVLGGVSLLPTCFLIFGVGIWGALGILMSTSGR